MSTKKKLKFPCKCGHGTLEHRIIEAPIWDTWCIGDMVEDENAVCECQAYRPDNLAYLAKQYSKKHKKRKAKGK